MEGFAVVRCSRPISTTMKIFVGIILAIVVFEVIEHVVAPLIWAFITRKRPSVSGAAGLLGEVAEVKFSEGKEGYVFVKGGLWKAVSSDPLSVGGKVVVQKVEGLTLKVSPLVESRHQTLLTTGNGQNQTKGHT